jgi:hypothetical protein
MAMLGEILEQLRDRSEVYQLLAETGDLALMARLDQAAHALAADPRDLALRAVRSFAEKADDEAWVKLIGRLQGSQSPAAACLSEMISWSLAN